MPQCSIWICAIRMRIDRICVGSNTIFQIVISADRPRYLHPGDTPRMNERPRQGVWLPCRGLSAISGRRVWKPPPRPPRFLPCSLSMKPRLRRSEPSSRTRVSCRPPLRCGAYSRASLTTPRHGNTPGSLLGGSRCLPCSRSGPGNAVPDRRRSDGLRPPGGCDSRAPLGCLDRHAGSACRNIPDRW